VDSKGTVNNRIGFSKGNQITSKIIMWLSSGSVSHAFMIYFDEDFKADYIFEATTQCIRIVPLGVYKKKYNIVAVYTPLHPLENGFVELGKWLGAKYDFTGLFSFIFVILGRIFKYRWRNFLASSDAMFCSEAVSNVLRWSKYPGFHYSPDMVSPEDLLNFCKKNMESVR